MVRRKNIRQVLTGIAGEAHFRMRIRIVRIELYMLEVINIHLRIYCGSGTYPTDRIRSIFA